MAELRVKRKRGIHNSQRQKIDKSFNKIKDRIKDKLDTGKKLTREEYSKLRAHWYAKLKDDGFEDAEHYRTAGTDTVMFQQRITKRETTLQALEDPTQSRVSFARILGLLGNLDENPAGLDSFTRRVYSKFGECGAFSTAIRAVATEDGLSNYMKNPEEGIEFARQRFVRRIRKEMPYYLEVVNGLDEWEAD